MNKTEGRERRCSGCGALMRPPTRWEALRRWFDNGSGMVPIYRCEQCGGMASGGPVLYRARTRSGLERWLRLPVDVLTTLRQQRTWHPVPRFYAWVMGISLLPAVALAAVTGSWWLWLLGLPVAGWVTVFVWSLATAFTSGRAGAAVLEVVAPRRARWRRVSREVEVAHRAVEVLPVLAPERWEGPVTIGGVAYSQSRHGEVRVHEMSVIADQDGTASSVPRLRIQIGQSGQPVEEDDLALRQFVANEVPPPGAPVDHLATAEDAFDGESSWEETEAFIDGQVRELAGQWRPLEVRLDGQPLIARGVTAAGSTLLRFELEGHPITVTAAGLASTSLELVRVADPEPLITAMEQRRHGMLDTHPR